MNHCRNPNSWNPTNVKPNRQSRFANHQYSKSPSALNVAFRHIRLHERNRKQTKRLID